MNPEPGAVRLTVLGCGDAFGSGGRLHTCFHVQSGEHRFLIDCGATALIGMRRFAIDPRSVNAVLITHFHADHFGGLPFLLTEARFSGRVSPLAVVGPAGLEARVEAARQALFPGPEPELPFELRFIEYRGGEPSVIGPLEVTAFPVIHSPATLPHALRISVDGRVISFTGDTEWTPVLADVAREADLFICECAGFDAPLPIHLDYATLLLHRPALECRRMMVTHMGPGALQNADIVARGLVATVAEDGLEVEIGRG